MAAQPRTDQTTTDQTAADQTAAGLRLPTSIQAAWGVAERPGKGPKPGLSLDRIVAAGIAVADAEGLAALSMGRVAKELGTAPMSLYRYVTAKTELLDLMLDTAYGPPGYPAVPGDWRAGLAQWGTVQLVKFTEHPWAVRVPISGPPITPNQVAWLEHGLSTMRDTGLAPSEKLSCIMLVSGYVRNWASLIADLRQVPDVMRHYAGNLRLLLDGQRFPEMTKLLDSTALEADDDFDDYSFGLARVLDGIGALIAARQ